VQDLIPDQGFTLLRLRDHDVSGLPFRVVDVRDERAREIYGADLILVRPDLHVAWRGNRPPDDPRALAMRVTGH
jgi:hypothetical protein